MFLLPAKPLVAKTLLGATTPETEAWAALYRKAEAAEPEFRRKLQENYERYARTRPHDASAFKRYCDGIVRAVKSTPDIVHLGGIRQKIIGMYFEGGMNVTRKVGRPRGHDGPEILFALNLVRLAREEAGKPPYKRTPIKEIQERCRKEGWGEHSSDHIRNALKAVKNTAD
jgi:hypothetical protein